MEHDQHPEFNPDLEEFRERFNTALVDILDFISLDQDSYYLPLRPHDIGIEDDPRGFEELTREEKDSIAQIAHEVLGVDEAKHIYRTYTASGPEKEDGSRELLEIFVYQTVRAEEGIYLHTIRYENGEELYVLAPPDESISS